MFSMGTNPRWLPMEGTENSKSSVYLDNVQVNFYDFGVIFEIIYDPDQGQI